MDLVRDLNCSVSLRFESKRVDRTAFSVHTGRLHDPALSSADAKVWRAPSGSARLSLRPNLTFARPRGKRAV